MKRLISYFFISVLLIITSNILLPVKSNEITKAEAMRRLHLKKDIFYRFYNEELKNKNAGS